MPADEETRVAAADQSVGWTRAVEAAPYVAPVLPDYAHRDATIAFYERRTRNDARDQISATMLGAQSINPNMKVKIVWVNSWFDPGKEADAAKALVDQGADILTQHTDSPAATQIAEQRGVHSFGESTDMIKFGPKAQLTADTDYWGGYYTKRAKDALEGKWTSEDTWGGLDSGMVVMAAYTNMPDDVKKMAKDTAESIRSSKFHPFKCPIQDQDGKTVECKGGDHLDPSQILSMNWYVKGIDDKIPGQ